MKTLYIVVPCYNEQEVLEWCIEKLQTVALNTRSMFSVDTHILLVDDGSADNTWSIAKQMSHTHNNVEAIKLSHNVGHQNALWAGMEWACNKCDAMVSIDADLQDDESAIVAMVREIVINKCDIVYGVRKERTTDSAFKRNTALAFYRIMKSIDSEIVYNHADFRMMTRRAVEALMQYKERNIFLRGLVTKLGFKTAKVYYNRVARVAGESKYPLKKMISFSVEGITSFSTAPLRFITLVGLAMTIVSVAMIIFGVIDYCLGKTIPGWTSLLVSLWLIGGIVTTGVGITGVYIGKIYNEVKQRPRYFIEESTTQSNEQQQ